MSYLFSMSMFMLHRLLTSCFAQNPIHDYALNIILDVNIVVLATGNVAT